MRFFAPCDACQEEIKSNPFRRDYALISCIECGISLRMTDRQRERTANNKGAYRQLLHGYRIFFMPQADTDLTGAVLMMSDAKKLNSHLMMVPQEFNALLSIERPLLRVATKSDALKRLFGSSVWVKYPDDGMSMLLARELMACGLDYVAYIACDEDEEADFMVDFDLVLSILAMQKTQRVCLLWRTIWLRSRRISVRSLIHWSILTV